MCHHPPSLGQALRLKVLSRRFLPPLRDLISGRQTHSAPAARNENDQNTGHNLAKDVRQELLHRHHLPRRVGFAPGGDVYEDAPHFNLKKS